LLDSIFLNNFYPCLLLPLPCLLSSGSPFFLVGLILIFLRLWLCNFCDSVKSFLTYFNAPLWLITYLQMVSEGIHVASFVLLLLHFLSFLSMMILVTCMSNLYNGTLEVHRIPKVLVPLMWLWLLCSCYGCQTLESTRTDNNSLYDSFMSCGARLSVYAFLYQPFSEARGFCFICLLSTGLVLAV
jgi:Fe2+ transport system protein B